MIYEFQAGAMIGDYRIADVVGRGGMSVVYAASEPRMFNRPVAVKVLAGELANDERMRRCFLREAEIIATVQHRNVIPVYSRGETDDGRPFIAMRLVDGVTLADWLSREGTVGAKAAAEIVVQVAAAVSAVHRHGLVHRDVKPSNILLEGGRRSDWDPVDYGLYLTDFGLASLDGTRGLAGEEDLIIGTPAYMPPEQWQGQPVDARSDVFQLGVLMHELLSGLSPLKRESEGATAAAAMSAEVAPLLRELALPAVLPLVVQRALARDPAARYASAADFARAAFAAAYELPLPAEHGRVVLEPVPPGRFEWDGARGSAAAPGPPVAAAPGAEPPGSGPAPPGAEPPVGAPAPTTGVRARDEHTVVPAAPRPVPAGPALPGIGVGSAPRPDGAAPAAPPPSPIDTRERDLASMAASLAEARPAHAVEEETVDCTVFAPPRISPDALSLIQVFLHRPAQADDARALAEEFDPAAKRRMFRGLEVPLPVGSVVDIELEMPSFTVHEPVQRLVWRGRAEAVSFATAMPSDHPAGAAHGTAIVRLHGMPIGRLGFQIAVADAVTTGPAVPLEGDVRRFNLAFISYAHADRAQVLRRVQGIAATGLAYFQDLLSLDPGQRHEPLIFEHIEQCDLFLLFWSKAAKDSDWVRRETRRALDRQVASSDRLPEIRPVILDGPPVELPWPELNHLHFGDRLIYVMHET